MLWSAADDVRRLRDLEALLDVEGDRFALEERCGSPLRLR